MKKIVLLLILFTFIGLPLVAQLTFDEYEQGFQDFADGVANALPFNSSIGLNWSDAYIDQFPHFGVGATIGFTTIPYDALSAAAAMLGITDLAGALGIPQLAKVGVPLPAYTVEARLGGFVLPFDMGIKGGYLPDKAKMLLPDSMGADYLLLGADFRFALLEETAVRPDISIGGGYNYMRGNVSLCGILGGDQDIDLSAVNAALANHWIRITDPDLTFNWQANVIDLKAQVSKKVLFITPYAGVGVSLGVSKAGGGLESAVLLSTTGSVGPYTAITQAEIDLIESIIGESLNLSDTGFFVQGAANGWGFRAFGGLSFNLFILKLDLNAMYNLVSGSLGATVNARVQL